MIKVIGLALAIFAGIGAYDEYKRRKREEDELRERVNRELEKLRKTMDKLEHDMETDFKQLDIGDILVSFDEATARKEE